MIFRPRRDRGIATNELAITAVLLLIGGSIAFASCEVKERRALDCLSNLALAADGKPARCPVADVPFGAGKAVCPDPKGHFPKPPRYEAGRLLQELPAVSTPPAEVGRRASVVTMSTNGSTAILHVKPRWWWRWLLGPLVQLVALVYFIALIVQFGPGMRESKSIIVVVAVAVIGFGWAGWHALSSESSEAIEIRRDRVRYRRWLFGVEREPRIYEACDGVVFVPVRDGKYSLAVLHRGPEGRAVAELIDGLAEGDVALASWLRSRN